MFVVVIDRLRQRVLSTVRILFLLALVAVLTVQIYGLFKTSIVLRSGRDRPRVPGRASQVRFRHDRLLNDLTRNLQRFYQGGT